MTTTDTKQTILAAARRMVQARGYNALSFRDLAAAVGIKSASIHYHFPTKADLGAALARRYAEDMAVHLQGLLAAAPDPQARMRSYTDTFRRTLLNDNRMCLYGIMTAERDDLPPEVRTEVDLFTQVNIGWLVEVLGGDQPDADTAVLRQRALAILAAIEGAQLVARGRGDVAVYDQTIAAYRTAGLLP